MRIGWVAVLSLALAACDKAPDRAASGTAPPAPMLDTVAAAPEALAPGSGAKPEAAPVAVSIPQIAYIYRYTFRLPGDAIGRTQTAHVALCDRLGPARCQIVSMQSSSGDGSYSGAQLKLRVASGVARRFGAELQDSVAKAGGRAVQSAIEAEDVSKELVDTDARLRQREMLVGRLTDILRNKTGKVSELVEAERSVAAAQEEVDQARSWLAVLRARVAMSSVEISYESIAASSSAAPSRIGDSIHTSASAFVIGITGLVSIAILLLPWAVVAGLLWLLWRRVRPMVRRRPKD